MNRFCFSFERAQTHSTVTQDECKDIFAAKESFESCFERETRMLGVFIVTPKGTFETNILLEKPENEFPSALRPFLPDDFIANLKQAARCLVFDIPVGCAFHVCRATESLMLAYHRHLTKQPWLLKKKDWNTYVQELTAQNAPNTITSRLNEIRAMERNPYIHPEKDASLEEAQVLYKLCSGVNFYILQEMAKP